MAVVKNFRALISGESWNAFGGVKKPVFITYSFDVSARDYLLANGEPQAFVDSFRKFSAHDKKLTQQALDQWEKASGIVFLQVKPGEGDIAFGKYDFNLNGSGQYAGYAYYPVQIASSYGSYKWQQGGDVFINTQVQNSMYLMLHEIGHALGLKHPFECNPILAPSLDNGANTVMSYDAPYGSKLGRFDKQAISYVYGNSDSDGAHLTNWKWVQASRTLIQTDGNTSDKMTGISTKDIMKGRGGSDQMASFEGNDRLFGGNGNDRALGGDGNDILLGNNGNDRLFGEAGADRLRGGLGADYNDGGSGNDVFEFVSVADSRGAAVDTIADFGDGADRIGLAAIDARTDASGNQAFAFIGNSAFSGNAGELRYEWTGSVTRVLADVNGDGAADFIVNLSGFHTLSASDFIL
jgi:hypothetical protein